MTDEERAEALREIASEALRLRIIATNAGAGMLAFLLEQALHEARAELGSRGLPIEPERPVADGDKVVRLKPR